MNHTGFPVERNGFSLLEVVVAIATAALLLALVLPAVAAVRESSRVTACRSNLKEVAHGIFSHEALYGSLPPFGWRVAILPQVDQTRLFQQFNKSSQTPVDFARVLRSGKLDLYLCPTDSAPSESGQSGVWAANYVGCYASNPLPDVDDQQFDKPDDGMFPTRTRDATSMHATHGRGRRVGEVVDGLSNTAMISEVLHSDGSRKLHRSVWYLDAPGGAASIVSVLNQCANYEGDPPMQSDPFGLGVPWYDPSFGASLYNHGLPPNRPSCRFGSWGDRIAVYTATSQHVAGVNVAYGDGRASFTAEGIDESVWRDIASCGNLVYPR